MASATALHSHSIPQAQLYYQHSQNSCKDEDIPWSPAQFYFPTTISTRVLTFHSLPVFV